MNTLRKASVAYQLRTKVDGLKAVIRERVYNKRVKLYKVGSLQRSPALMHCRSDEVAQWAIGVPAR